MYADSERTYVGVCTMPAWYGGIMNCHSMGKDNWGEEGRYYHTPPSGRTPEMEKGVVVAVIVWTQRTRSGSATR